MAVYQYVRDKGCTSGADGSECAIGRTHGWPINEWCVKEVMDMSTLFSNHACDDEDGNNEDDDYYSANFQNYYVHDPLSQDDIAFNSNLSSWDVSKVTTMRRMFCGAHAFNGNVSTWNVARVTNMNRMFHDARAFNGNLKSWYVWNVRDMHSMFRDAKAFNGDLSTWRFSTITSINQMFSDTASFDQDLCAWVDFFPYKRGSHIFDRTLYDHDPSAPCTARKQSQLGR